MSFRDEIIKAIRATMPQNAEIQVVPGIREFCVQVSWKLNNDPERTDKMSKSISVCVSHEAEQDLANALFADEEAEAVYKRVKMFISAKLAYFDPQHNTPKFTEPPIEKWVINSAVVLG